MSQLEGLSKRLCEELVSMVSTGDSSQGKVARLFRELDRVHVELAGLRRNDVAAGMHRDGKAA